MEPRTYCQPLMRREKGSRRPTWAILSFLFAVTGLIVESKMDICSVIGLRPLGDPVTAALYISTAATLLLNEYALRLRWRHIPGLRALALLFSGMALPVAIMTALYFVPVIPISVLLIAMFGLGLLVWVPFLATGTLIAQVRTIWSLSRDNDTPGQRYAMLFAASLAALLSTGWCIYLFRHSPHGAW
jgi:hypothetical protein